MPILGGLFSKRSEGGGETSRNGVRPVVIGGVPEIDPELLVAPVIDRDALHERYETFNKWGARYEDVMKGILPAGVSRMTTSGTRGTPIPWLYDEGDRKRWLGSITALLGPGVMWVAPAPLDAGVHDGVRIQSMTRLIDRLAYDMLDEKPRVLVATPSILYALAARGCEWRPERVYATGDRFKPSQEPAVRGHFGRVGEVYAGAWGVLGVSCARGVWHLDTSRWQLELIDALEGEGWSEEALRRVYITPRVERGMMVRRYALSDYLVPLVGECSCGMGGLTVGGIEGRVEDVWHLVNRRGEAVYLYPSQLERAVEAADERIRDYELSLVSPDRATMRLVIPGFDMRGLSDRVIENLREVCFKRGAEMPRLTWIWKPPLAHQKRRLIAGAPEAPQGKRMSAEAAGAEAV